MALHGWACADDRVDATRSRIAFDEVAAAAGISFQFHGGSRGRHDLPEIMGGGAALLDVDGDGLLDVYLCNGGPIDPALGVTAGGSYLASGESRLVFRLGTSNDVERIEVRWPWGQAE